MEEDDWKLAHALARVSGVGEGGQYEYMATTT